MTLLDLLIHAMKNSLSNQFLLISARLAFSRIEYLSIELDNVLRYLMQEKEQRSSKDILSRTHGIKLSLHSRQYGVRQ